MNLKQQLKEKNNFLRKAYEKACEYHPSSPLSVSLDPRAFGASIGYDNATTERIMIELVDDGYVTSSLGMGMLVVTNLGLGYLREIENEPLTVASHAGHSIITNNYNISIQDSPNSNIVNQSNEVTIVQSISEASQVVEKIREAIAIDSAIDKQKAAEILECLNEIQEGLKNNQKPKFAIKTLIDLASDISSIGAFLLTLGQFAGVR